VRHELEVLEGQERAHAGAKVKPVGEGYGATEAAALAKAAAAAFRDLLEARVES
jgi:pantoate kinase